MAQVSNTPRGTSRGRPRGRPPGSGTGNARLRKATEPSSTEPPNKRKKYVPGGLGGGGRFVDVQADGNKAAPTRLRTERKATARRPRASSSRNATVPLRERSTRIRTAVSREEADEFNFSSAAAVAAAVVQSEGYKPREERGWEEFHPNLDIEATFMVFHAEEVDGTTKSRPATSTSAAAASTSTQTKEAQAALASATNSRTGPGIASIGDSATETPSRRRIIRPARDSISLYATRPPELPKRPQVLPIHNQTPKERLDLKLPSYRKTDRIALFESKQFGQARYVDKAMMNAGYQESDMFVRPGQKLVQAMDANADEEAEQSLAAKIDGDSSPHYAGTIGRVEYDMDEQDDMWLERVNAQRKSTSTELEPITREIFEITITKIEKEWHALEKRIPKPNPKPPQTHRPRSSSAAAVNGEPQAGEEQDTKCAICDDGDCENTNAIVFCDGCDLAVHQECYGVPFIPEGQWLCRKCQLIGRGIPTCIFCPNTDGAFKQTNSSKWAHLLCAIWIPEVSLGNHTFMEPVMEVDKVPRTRWRLTCYICNQRMGACIQCSNKNCYQAFHVTCARKCRLYLKMKNSNGALAVLDGSMLLKAYCDKHCPEDYGKENAVAEATREAGHFYKRTMRGRIWADSQASALQIAATHRHATTEHPPDESQKTGAKVMAVLENKKRGQANKAVWKLPSGAPIIPQTVYDAVDSSLARFSIRKRKDFIADCCRYWTLKREARRGAALLKRLQLQMETFTSMELTRRDFASMGPSGRDRLARRIDFVKMLLGDLEHVKDLTRQIVQREKCKLDEAEMQADFVDTCYFPVYTLLANMIEKALGYDKNVFRHCLLEIQARLDKRFYTTTLAFAHELCEAIRAEINRETKASTSKHQSSYSEAKDRKRLGKRILKSLQPQLEAALRAEADINSEKPLDALRKELDRMIEASLELRPSLAAASQAGPSCKAELAAQMVGAPPEERPAEDPTKPSSKDARDDDDAGLGGADAAREPETDCGGQDASEQAVPPDKMDLDGHGDRSGQDLTDTSRSSVRVNGIASSSTLVAVESADAIKSKDKLATDMDGSHSPPTLDGYSGHATQSSQAGPLTPPQSNGSFGGQRRQPDTLNEGGVPWYLKGFDVQGTTAVEEGWDGREAMRSLSEELTDMDDDQLRDLEFDVEDEINSTSPAGEEPEPAVKSNHLTTAKRRTATRRQRKGIRRSTRSR